MTRACFQVHRSDSSARVSRVASLARRGLVLRSRYRASCFRRNKFSALKETLERVHNRMNRMESRTIEKSNETTGNRAGTIRIAPQDAISALGRANPYSSARSLVKNTPARIFCGAQHSSLRTTSRYTHFQDEYRQQVANDVGLLSGVRKENCLDGPNGPKFSADAAESKVA